MTFREPFQAARTALAVLLLAVGGAACGGEETQPAASAQPGAQAPEAADGADAGAARLAEEAAEVAENAAEHAEEAAEVAGEAAEAAEQLSDEAARMIAAATYTDEREAVEVVTTRLNRVVVFVPATLVVASGPGRKLRIYNDTEIPHGFRIPSLGVEAILEPGVDTEVALPDLDAGALLDVECQLHAPHRHATLVVVPSD